uniref:FLYWCH-type domain-containing protein n=1 Tax=Meloidogyne enterolobii TaxID=390850 RepID=A0A6V7Y2Z9_MELEN|nr:unnamed protein product [Meloidogyne enterolobii]CAD2205896.1 unnamed protein product [Meloidogyne enterolobii]
MASFVKSTKNADKLVFEGFIYVKYKNGAANKRYWRCEYWRSCVLCEYWRTLYLFV